MSSSEEEREEEKLVDKQEERENTENNTEELNPAEEEEEEANANLAQEEQPHGKNGRTQYDALGNEIDIQTKRIQFTWSASPNALEGSVASAEIKLAQLFPFDLGGKKKGETNGNVQPYHILHSVKMVSYVNTFPFSVGLRVEGIKIPDRQGCTTHGVANDFMFYPKVVIPLRTDAHLFSQMDTSKRSEFEKFFSNYPSYTLENLDKGFVGPITKEYVTTTDHPFAGLLQIIEKDGVKLKGVTKVKNKINIHEEIYNKFWPKLQDLFRIHSVRTNLNNAELHFFRAFQSEQTVGQKPMWTDKCEFGDTIGNNTETFQKMNNMQYRITGELEVRYETHIYE